MKKFIFSALSLIFLVQLFTACDKTPVDLMTADSKTGGIVIPNKSIAYLLGATPVVNVALEVPKGPGIASIEVYNRYLRRADTTYSTEALMKTIEVGSSNSAESVAKDYTITYADLSSGITVDGDPLPADENLLPIGDTWELKYISIMDDGRRVENSAITKIDVSNRWAASYLMSGYALREGDPVLTGYFSDIPWKLATNSAKSVIFTKIQVWGDGTSTVGGIGPWVLTMDDSAGPDAPMPVTVTDAVNTAVKNNPAYNSRYEPSTKTFYISVFWGGGPTNRAAVDTLVYSGPY
jgi:hypothetical protein